MKIAEPVKILLPVDLFPRYWYNIIPDLEKVGKVVAKPKDKAKIDLMKEYIPPSLLKQEESKEREIPIPDELREPLLRAGRPTPLQRAVRLEKYLKTPAKIYYKREDTSYCTTDKTNTAIPQAYYAANDGFEKIIGGGGAQWGSAISIGANYQGIACEFFLPQSYLELKEPHRILMEVCGTSVIGSPSDVTKVGSKVRKEKKYETGNISLSISEAIEKSIDEKKSVFAFGSFFNYTMLHQTISGIEAKEQFKLIDKYPDVVIASIDSFGGFAFPFIVDRLAGKTEMKFIISQSKYVPVLTEGKLEYDHADYGELTPMYRFHSLSHIFDPPLIHAGEFRYHGISPIISLLIEAGIIEIKSYGQIECFEAGTTFAKIQGVIPSHETQYAVKAVIEEALKAKEEGKEEVILFNSAGHTMLESTGYLEYLIDYRLYGKEFKFP